ncbi:MbtH family NRPS accessory protein [Dactylosporangium salmoneum]|uniref:MbtH-like domain-containing protein n=1 Tax=Dactylosporangium salmoneum TaxID=53361 RepID=A0ABP5U9B3_9ACTN
MTVVDQPEQSLVDYRVVINADDQYSIWAAADNLPTGWVAEGHRGTRDECLDHIERVWTDQTPARTRIRAWLTGAVSEACDGRLTPGDVATADCSFVAMGVSSLAVVRLVDAIETEYDVAVDFTQDALQDLDSLTECIAAERLRRRGGG